MNLDITGSNPENRKTVAIPINYNGGEVAILTPQGGFFHTSMSSPVVIYKGETLVYGKDYRYGYKSKEIRERYQLSAHGSIVLTRKGLTGQIDLTASYLGGPYRLYKTDYVSYISSTDYLLSLYDINDLIDLPDDLPPMASLLDMEAIKSGMTSHVQMIYTIGHYLRVYEDELEEPSNPRWWPDLQIEDRVPPIEINITFPSPSRGSAIPADNLALQRIGLVPLGAMPVGLYTRKLDPEAGDDYYPRMGVDAALDAVPMDYVQESQTYN